ncbi:sensor histidine kinase [Streptomyces sp. NRRL WC-3742]|uniref:sensor histidine kinase n=1 Tax=Streptomyces sp. NRRL WC-3742 TaxID=1463934 RepID=UPI00131D3BDA|nr:sensor histidine kinase [Streptomyces sp. NRRL WC-3742]
MRRPFAPSTDDPALPTPPALPRQLPRPVTVLAPTVMVLLMLVPLATHDPEVGPTTSRPLNAALMAAGALVLVLRRRWPEAVALFTLVGGQLPLAFALYALTALRGRSPVASGLAALAVARLLGPFDLDDLAGISQLANLIEDPLVFGVVPIALGLTAHQRARTVSVLAEHNRLLAERNRLLEERNQLLEEARLHAEERAAAAERARLAREMHDVVSNRVSLITLHAGGARLAQTGDPEAVGETLGLIRTLGLQALTELRGLLGVLTPSSDDGPSLRGLPALVQESRQAGLAVELSITGTAEAGPAAQYAAYRIVQEALTNAHKHASTAEVAVTLAATADGLRLAVVNSPASEGTSDAAALPSGGHGLDGMRTRATDLGGTLEAGPTPDGGFAVRARLPLS